MNMLLIFLIFLNSHTTSSQIKNTAIKLSSISNQSSNIQELVQTHHKSTNHSITSLPKPKWSDWSPWSKCRKCTQKRMKICMSQTCDYTRTYQERQCQRKKCKRRRNQQEDFHVLMPEKGVSPRMADQSIWGSWSEWSMCNQNCRTNRRRYCRKPGRCQKKKQIQNAYCYHGETKCEKLVYNLMQMQDQHLEKRKYNYNRSKRRGKVIDPSMRCGRQYKKTRMLKIVGGTESPRYKWPWHVALINQYAEVFCGGTLIAPEWVLTASHCVRKFLIVRLNEHDLRYTDGRELELVVQKIFRHPQFNIRTVNGDIALLKLPLAVKTPVACLPTNRPIPRQLCSVMGWGKTRTHARKGVPILRETQIPVVEQEVCKWAYRDLMITDNMVCAGWASGKADTCAGDSGGGLMCPQKRRNSRRLVYSVQGITSFGKGCGKRNKYGIYTVVYNYINWIRYIMRTYR